MAGSKLLHILGGGPWQLPTMKRAQALGHRVLVTDYTPERPAYALADAHECVDITDAERTLEVARRHAIDGIVCDTTDTGVRTAAAVAERLGLAGAGVDAADICTDKSRLRAVAQAAGLTAPLHVALDDAHELHGAAALVGWPLVVKPVDNQSGRGVSIVREAVRLDEAYRYARDHSRAGRVLLERCVEGVEYIVDGFVCEGHVHLLGIASKVPSDDNPTIAARILYLGGDDFDQARRALEPATRTLLRAVNLRGGIFHAEFIVGPDTRPVPIDLAARGGGVMIYTHVLPQISGVDTLAATIGHALRQPVDVRVTRRRAACIDFLRAPPGRLAALGGLDDAVATPGIAAVHIGASVGDDLGVLRMKDDRPGFVIAVADTADEAIDIAARARDRLRLQLSGQCEMRCFY